MGMNRHTGHRNASPSFTTTSLPNVTAGQSYSATLQADMTGVTWSVANLPSWLTLNAATGVLSGTAPTNVQSVTLQVTATTSSQSAKVSLPLSVQSSLSIGTTSLPAAVAGQYYSTTLQANETGVTWKATGLPTWLSLNASSGVLSGTVPSSAQAATLQIEAQDTSGHVDNVSLTLTIQQPSTTSTGGGGGYSGGGGGSSTGSSTGSSSTGDNTGTTTGSTTPTPPDFSTIVVSQSVSPQAAATVTKTVSGSTVTLSIPKGAFSSTETVSITTVKDASTVVAVVPKDNTVVAAFGVTFSGAAPKQAVTLTIKNSSIPAGAEVFKLDSAGNLVPVQTTVKSGEIDVKFTTDPNFVILVPPAMPTLKAYERVIQFNDKYSVVPAVVHNGTTYVPIWYVENLLKTLNVSAKWNGHTWALATTGKPDMTSLSPGHGTMSITLNGTLVQHVTGIVAVDPFSHKPTTYMPIWYVMQILQRLNVDSTWNGSRWVLGEV